MMINRLHNVVIYWYALLTPNVSLLKNYFKEETSSNHQGTHQFFNLPLKTENRVTLNHEPADATRPWSSITFRGIIYSLHVIGWKLFTCFIVFEFTMRYFGSSYLRSRILYWFYFIYFVIAKYCKIFSANKYYLTG